MVGGWSGNMGLTNVGVALRRCRTALLGVAFFSCIINLLGLTGSIYMLQVYDRVLISGSIPTLVTLTVAMVGLYFFYGLLDFVRLRILVGIASRFDRSLHKPLFAINVALPLRYGQKEGLMQPLSELDQIRTFISNGGPTAFFDMPWLPLYLYIIYILHPYLGLLATIGGAVSVALTLLMEVLARAPQRRARESMINRQMQASAARRNAEVVRAMGLTDRFGDMWSEQSDRFLKDQRIIADVVGTIGVLSRTWRIMLQSLMLGLGAYLVIAGEATSGIIIASSIMLARALAPIDVALTKWREFIMARHSYSRLKELDGRAVKRELTALPRPTRNISVEELAVAPPGLRQPIIQRITFSLNAGSALGIIGPSASGKSTLLRALVGAWLPLRGKVRFDDAAIDQWDEAALGRDIGYLPQDIELFDGTVAQNICRFDPDAQPAAILAAADAAGIRALILRLPEGFQTELGDGGAVLSAGQRQLVGLARALYGDPFLVVLDEPNSNLDAEGDAALASAIKKVRDRGGIAVVVAHRPSAIVNIDLLLYMAGGTMQAFGPRDEVLAHLAKPRRPFEPDGPEPRGKTVVPLHERRQERPW